MNRLLWVKVGGDAARGPLPEKAVRDSWESGVLSDEALAGESETALVPIAQLLGPRRAAVPVPPPAPAPPLTAAPRKSRAGVIVPAMAAVAACALIGLGVFGFQWWQANKPPALCRATPHLLASLKSHLRIDVYVTNKNAKLALAARNVERLLAAMKTESHGHLEYRIVDASDEVNARMAQEAGLQAMDVGFADLTEATYEKVYFGATLAYGLEKDKITVLTPDLDIPSVEFWLINKIREIVARADGKKQRIGVVTGHHEIALGDANLVPQQGASIRSVISQYFPFYELVDVDLRGGAEPVPDDVAGLLVTQPTDEWTDAELRRIDDHVMRGRALAIVASAAAPALGDASMRIKLSAHGLGRLVAGYGLELGEDLVFDEKRPFSMTAMTTTRTTKLAFSFIPIAKEKEGLDASSSIFFRLNQLSFPFASSIVVHKERQPNAVFRSLANTSNESVRTTGKEVYPRASTRGEGARGETVVAASVEGPLKSAFGEATSKKPARVVLVASSMFFANPFVYAGRSPFAGTLAASADPGAVADASPDAELTDAANTYAQSTATNAILAAKNLLDWLTFDDDFAGCLPTSASGAKDERKK